MQTTAFRDETILSIVNKAQRMLYNYATAYRLDIEDLSQGLALYLLEKWDALLCRVNTFKGTLEGYLYGVARRWLLRQIPKDRLVSLDVPLSEDSDETLGDTIPEKQPSLFDENYVDSVIRRVHGAVHRSSPECQFYALRDLGFSSLTLECNTYAKPYRGLPTRRWTKAINAQAETQYAARSKASMKSEIVREITRNDTFLWIFGRNKNIRFSYNPFQCISNG